MRGVGQVKAPYLFMNVDGYGHQHRGRGFGRACIRRFVILIFFAPGHKYQDRQQQHVKFSHKADFNEAYRAG
jgi:hypothetical protein